MDKLLERTVHRGMVDTSVGSESFSDLDFADDVALLACRYAVVAGSRSRDHGLRSVTTRPHHQLVKDQDSVNA